MMRAGSMSTRLKLALLSAALLVAAALPSTAQAAGTTTINFDNLPAFTQVREQYAPQGVRFGPPSAFGLPVPAGEPCDEIVHDEGIHGRSLYISCTHGETHQGTNVAMEFEDPRRQVAYTLLNNDYTGTRTVTITEYKVNHEVIQQSTAQLPAKTPATFSPAPRPQADIAYLSIVEEGIPHDGYGVFLDDISAPIEDGRSPAFTLAVIDPAVEVVEAGTGTATVGVRRFGGSTGGVKFEAGTLPPGVTGVEFEPNPVAGRDPTTMKISLGHNVHSDLQVPIKIVSTGSPGVGSPGTTTGVVTVHPVPAITFNSNLPRVVVPGCTNGGPSYFSVRGGFSGSVGVTARVISGDSVVISPDVVNFNTFGNGTYAFEMPFSYSPWPDGDPRNSSPSVVRYRFSPGFGDTAVEGDEVIRPLPLKVASVTQAFQDFTPGIQLKGTLPYSSCHFKVVDELGQEYAVTSSSVENGQDVLGLKPPAGFAAVSAPNGLRILSPDGKTLLARTGPITVSSFRNTYALRFANQGTNAGSQMYPWDDFVKTYGEDDAYSCFIGCVKDPVAVNYWEKWLGRVKQYKGLCYGFSVTALRFHGYNETSIKASSFQAGAPNAWGITEFADGSPMKREVVRMHYSQFDKDLREKTTRPFPGPSSMAQRVVQWKEQVHSLVNRFGGALTFIYQGTEGHAVVTTRVEDNPDGGFTLFLYDPNAPYTLGEQTEPEVRAGALSSSQIVVKGDGTWKGSSLGWEGNLNDLMFPYNWPNGLAKLPKNLSLESWLGATVTSTKVDGKEALKPNGVPVDGSPVVLQEDWSGGKGNYYYSLDKGHTYEIELRQEGNEASFSDTGLGSSVGVDAPGAKTGQTDHVTVTPGQPELTYEPGANTGNVTLHVVDAGAAKVRHTADVTLDSSGGKPDQVELKGSTLTVDHAGAPTKVSISLGSLGSGLPEGGALSSIRLGAGQKLELKPNWGALSAGVPYVVRDAKGKIIRKGIARLRPSRSLKLGALSAKVTGKQAIVSGKVTKGGKSPMLAITAEAVSAGGKVVARKSASLEGKKVRSGRKYKVPVKLPKVPGGGKLQITATLVDQEAGVGAGVATKTIALR
jgi:hypothetical protein